VGFWGERVLFQLDLGTPALPEADEEEDQGNR